MSVCADLSYEIEGRSDFARHLIVTSLLCGRFQAVSAPEVEQAMRKAIKTLPSSLIKTITWDQGSELARHLEFTIATGVRVYFCDPHSPWQRGSNENTNGLLRQYMPKSTDLSKYSRADLKRIQDSLNDRPRKTLGFLKPVEKLSELVALTA